MSYKHYVTYLPSNTNKEFNRIGTCSGEDFNIDFLDGSIRLEVPAFVTRDTHYIDSSNNLCEYTYQQILERSTKPSYFYKWDMGELRWVDIRNFSEKQIDKWTEIKQIRTQLEFGKFTWGGSIFDGDSESQRRIQGASQLAMIAASASQPFEIDWTLADNTVRTLSGEEMIAVGLALGTHVSTQHEIARLLRIEIETATTEEELNAVSWPMPAAGTIDGQSTVVGVLSATTGQAGTSDGTTDITGES